MNETTQRFIHNAMASVFEILIDSDEPDYARQVARDAFNEVDRLEGFLSRFIMCSDISQINHAPVGEWVSVSDYAVNCLKVAQRAHAETRGAYDATIGPLMACWRNEDYSLIDAPTAAIEAARACVGMQYIEIDDSTYSVRRTRPGVDLDLGALGKGYVVDRVVEMLHEWDFHNVLVNTGDSTTFGVNAPTDSEGWRVSFGGGEGEVSPYVVPLRNQALSGSGVTARGRHIMDPRTGRPVFACAAAWTLVHAGEIHEEGVTAAAMADALSTAFFVMTPEEVDAYCREHPEVCAMLLHGEPGAFRRYQFGAWPELEAAEQED